MTFTAHGRDLAVGSVAYGTFDVDAGYAERDVRLHATLRHPQAGEVTVDGHVPADLAWAGPRVDD